ncbi:MAG TPA: TylF/MycF/NovP-related O-methyltransferase [Planctomycetaceae bacterium]|nr:TylF/MycF/NovP-related O-methyltransferase [Planctomycetaceae bacterium]
MTSPPRSQIIVKSGSTPEEEAKRQSLFELFDQCPIPAAERLDNLGLFIKRQALSRILWMHELYQKIIDVPGIVIEFGVRWGQNLALFESFRGMYEPYNYTRKIVGFDTFSGFPQPTPQDGNDPSVVADAYRVSENYQAYLENLLAYHESECPISHIKKFDLIRGDAPVKLAEYLDAHPETIIALAYFDFDLYEPTKKCLELIRDRLTRGSVLGFDELNFEGFPGETIALRETLGLDRYALRRSPHNPLPSYLVID